MYLSDAQVIGSVIVAVFSSITIGVIIGLIRNPIYMPGGLTGFSSTGGSERGEYSGSSSSYVNSHHSGTKCFSPEYMLKKGKFHKVKSKMHKRKKEHRLDFAEIEKNNFKGYEYLKKPYLLSCVKG